MRIVKVFCGLLASFAFFALLAQDADYQGWMKSVAGSNGKMNKGIAAKDAAAAAEAANLETVFKQVEAFWTKKGGAADAVGFAKQAHMAAAAAGKAINAGNWEQAAAEGKNVGATCGGCHAAHRGGEKGNFQIK
jgi:hypothetical protein